MDEIYGNLENYNDVNLIDELRSENKELKLKLENYAKTIESLQRDFDKVSKEFKNLELNYSSLLKTARAEIERKTQIISNLNVEKDMLVLETLKNGNRYKRNVRSFTSQNKETGRMSDKQLPEEESIRRRNSESYHKRHKSKSKENFREDASKNDNSDKDTKPNVIQDQQLLKQCPTFSSDEEVVAQKQRSLLDDNDTKTIDKHYNKNSTKRTERFRNEKSSKLQFYPEEVKHYRSWNSKKYNEDTNKRREKCDIYQKHSSPVRYRKDNDYVIDSKHRRNRVLESPPQTRNHYHKRTRDFHSSYEKSRSRDRHYERDKNLFKHNTLIDFHEPESKRAKPSYSEEDLDKYAFVSCQSPDLLIDDDVPTSLPIKEIMGIAETTLEDPRQKSNKYEIKSENDKITLSTTYDREVDLKVIDITTWNNITIPNALMQEPLEYNEVFIQEVYRDIENLATHTSVESDKIVDSVVTNDDVIKLGTGNQECQRHDNDFNVKESDCKPCSEPEHNTCLDSASTCITTTETSSRESIVVMDSTTNDAVKKCETIIHEEQEHCHKKFSNYFNMKDSNHESSLKPECKISEDSLKKSTTITETGDGESAKILDSKPTNNVSKHDLKNQEDEHCHKKLRYDFEFKGSGYIPCPKPETDISFNPKKFKIPKHKNSFSDTSPVGQCSVINTLCNTADKDVNTTKTDYAEVDLALSDAGNNTKKSKKTTLSKEDMFETKNHKTKKITVNEKKIKKPKKTKKRTDSVNEIKMLSNDENKKLARDNQTEKFSELFGDISNSLITPEDLKLDATVLKSRFISNMSSDLEDAQNAMDINVSDMLTVQSFKGIRDICNTNTSTDIKNNSIDEKNYSNKDVDVEKDNGFRIFEPEDQDGVLDPCPSIDNNVNVVKTEIISTGFQPECDLKYNISTPNIPLTSTTNEECHGESFSATSTPNKSADEVQQEDKVSINNGDSIDQPATKLPNSQPDDIPDVRIRIVRRRRKVLKI